MGRVYWLFKQKIGGRIIMIWVKEDVYKEKDSSWDYVFCAHCNRNLEKY